MKDKIILSLMILLLVVPVTGYTVETYNTVYVNGKAPIVIDGNLSDWEWLDLTPVSIENLVYKYEEKPWEQKSEVNFSASFQCFRDDSNVYIAFMVTDDVIIFGQERYGQCFRDDAVEIIILGSQAVSPVTGRADVARIFISAHENGTTKLEGREPQSLHPSYPVLRKIWGIMATLSQTENGYTVEIAIPLTTLNEWAEWENGQPLRMNVRAYDDDIFEEINQTYLEWAGNIFEWPPNENYDRHAPDKNFNEIVFVDNISGMKPMDNSSNTVSDIEVVVTEPDQTGYSGDISYQLSLGIALEKTGFYEEAVEELEKINFNGGSIEIQNKARLSLARNYFLVNELVHAKQLSNELLNSNVDSKTALDAQMILLSIERKMK